MLSQLMRKIEAFGRPPRFMEVCGTHTHAFGRSGLRQLLSGHLELRSGPGCPVCVTPTVDIDRAIHLAHTPDTMICTYGDMMRVPGSASTLAGERGRGADVRVVYSASQAVALARSHGDASVVFIGVGFETTAPALALALEEAEESGLRNFYVLSLQKTVPPALGALLRGGDMGLDGLVLPGHVSTVIGRESFDFLGREPGIPAVIAGFEPVDLLAALLRLTDMVIDDENRVVNAYSRVVGERGNPAANAIVNRFLAPGDAAWRGLGTVEGSGMYLREDKASRDANNLVADPPAHEGEPPDCRCGDVLTGRIRPGDCALFGSACTPESPVGPCMVSSEGACAAHYLYGSGVDGIE